MAEMLDFEAFKERHEKVSVEEYPNNVREAVPEPLVSVHLLTYNHVDYIQDAVDSVLMQEVDFPIEIVIGDDESTDGTREICKEYAEQHPEKIRLMLHRRENNIEFDGRPTHLFQYWYNTLTLRGKYIAVLSGDDYWVDQKKLIKQANFLNRNPSYGLSFHDAKVINEKSEKIESSKAPEENKKIFTKKELMEGPYLPALSIFCKNIFEEVPNGLVLCLNEDKVMISLLGSYGKGAFQKDVIPAVYRVHKNSIWSSESGLSKAKALAKTFKSLRTYYGNYKSLRLKKYFTNRYLSELKKMYQEYVLVEDYLYALEVYMKVIANQIAYGKYRDIFSFGRKALRDFIW